MRRQASAPVRVAGIRTRTAMNICERPRCRRAGTRMGRVPNEWRNLRRVAAGLTRQGQDH